MKKAKIFITILLCTLLMLTLFNGCIKVVESGNEGASAAKTEAPTEAGSKIIWSGQISVAPYMWGPYDEKENKIELALEDGFRGYGYDVDLKNIYIENSQYNELINTRIASGDAPDIFEARDAARMKDLYNQGALATWDKDFFIEKAPALYAFIMKGGVDGRIAKYVDMFWELSMIDGKMVTVAGFHEAGASLLKCMIFRGDWLDNLGVTELPYTLDDFIALMYRFANEDPNKNNKKDTYGFSTSVAGNVFCAFDGYNGFPKSSPQWYYRNGSMICASVLPTNKDALAVLAKCYADGVLDPEFVAGENQGGYWAINHSFVNGKIGASCHSSIAHYLTPDVTGTPGPVAKEYYAVNGENAKFVYAPWPAGPTGNFGYGLGYAAGIGENPLYSSQVDKDKLGAILAIFDICSKDDEIAALTTLGIEGVTYEKYEYNGKPTMKYLMQNVDLNRLGVWAFRGIYGVTAPFNEYVQRLNFYNEPTWATIHKIQAQKQYFGGYISDLYENTASTSKYQNELITYRDETFIKIIKGELSVDYYDTYVQEWMKRGGETLTKEANEWYNAKKKK